MSERFNTIEAAKIFQQQLDELAVQSLFTGFMEQNTNGIKYTGGDEIKIPDIDMDGQANYNRNTGYVKGAVNVAYQTLKMTQDRGRKFYLDAMEVDESNFIAEASRVMGKYQKTKVIPEIDAYRISKLATYAMGVDGDLQARYNYTLDGNIIKEIKKGIKTVRENGADEVFILATYDTVSAVEEVSLGKLQSVTFSQGGIDTRVPSIDGCPLIYVPSNRMYSSIQLLDGTTVGQEQGGYKKADDAKSKLQSVTFSQGGIDTRVPSIDGCPLIYVPSNRMYSSIQLLDGTTVGQEQGGYKKADDAKNINFVIVDKSTPIAVTKQDIVRIFDPTVVQDLNAWQLDYRRFHDLWVLKNQMGKIYVNVQEAK